MVDGIATYVRMLPRFFLPIPRSFSLFLPPFLLLPSPNTSGARQYYRTSVCLMIDISSWLHWPLQPVPSPSLAARIGRSFIQWSVWAILMDTRAFLWFFAPPYITWLPSSELSAVYRLPLRVLLLSLSPSLPLLSVLLFFDSILPLACVFDHHHPYRRQHSPLSHPLSIGHCFVSPSPGCTIDINSWAETRRWR